MGGWVRVVIMGDAGPAPSSTATNTRRRSRKRLADELYTPSADEESGSDLEGGCAGLSDQSVDTLTHAPKTTSEMNDDCMFGTRPS